MAKRKRLGPADILASGTPAPETKSMGAPFGGAAPRAPIAQVAGEASAQAALDVLSDEVAAAKAEGRMVLSLPLAAVRADHLTRDRLGQDEDEAEALRASLAERGQQTPIEVVDLGGGSYGLISGWRRLMALSELYEATGDPRFGLVQALVRDLKSEPDAYIAMVEENEIRANLSFYERARLAAEAAGLGLYPSTQDAVRDLFKHAPKAKRSKINSFVVLHEALGSALAYPTAIPETLGLALVKQLSADPKFRTRLKDALRKTPPQSATEERQRLEAALSKAAGIKKAPAPSKPAPKGAEDSAGSIRGVTMDVGNGRVTLIGPAVNPELIKDLRAWLHQRQK